jgi:hypothetical protein
MRYIIILLIFFISYQASSIKFSPSTITCIQDDYNGMFSIMWVFEFNDEFTELKSLSTENYSNFNDFFILKKKDNDLIYFNERINGNEFVLNLKTMKANWDTIGGISYYCKKYDLRSK